MTEPAKKRGAVFVLSGPSGSGKDSILTEFFKGRDDTAFSISSITRPMREGEIEGQKYHFISRPEFESLIAADKMLEYAEYCGNLYGTPREPVQQWLAEGKNVLIEVDVQGADKIRRLMPDAVFIFLLPPSQEVLRQRLIRRGTESEESVQRRLTAAIGEMQAAGRYDYIIINDHLPDAAALLSAIVAAENARVKYHQEFLSEVMKSC